MKFLAACVMCVVLSVAAAYGLWIALEFSSRNSSEIQYHGDLSAVQQQYEVIEQSQVDLRVKIKRLEATLKEYQTKIEDLTLVASRAEAKIAARTEQDGANEIDAEGADDDSEEDPPLTLDEAVELIADRELSFPEKAAIWKDLAKRGMMDQAVEYFENVAAENPDDPQAQTNLGPAYIHKLLNSNDLEKAILAMKADNAYDRVLEVDDQHWEARFSKAMSYSYAPPLLGLQTRAIEQFEILREQQEAQAPLDHYSQTYLHPGNLYANQGSTAKAQSVWKAGLEIFPDSQEISRLIKPAEE